MHDELDVQKYIGQCTISSYSNRSEFIGKKLTGEEFKQLYADYNFVKITNYNEEYHISEFDASLSDSQEIYVSGEIYFIRASKIPLWIYDQYYIYDTARYTRKVTIPDDALICIEEYEFKSNKVILGPKKAITTRGWIKAYIDQIDEYIPSTMRAISDCDNFFDNNFFGNNFIIRNKNYEYRKMNEIKKLILNEENKENEEELELIYTDILTWFFKKIFWQ